MQFYVLPCGCTNSRPSCTQSVFGALCSEVHTGTSNVVTKVTEINSPFGPHPKDCCFWQRLFGKQASWFRHCYYCKTLIVWLSPLARSWPGHVVGWLLVCGFICSHSLRRWNGICRIQLLICQLAESGPTFSWYNANVNSKTYLHSATVCDILNGIGYIRNQTFWPNNVFKFLKSYVWDNEGIVSLFVVPDLV